MPAKEQVSNIVEKLNFKLRNVLKLDAITLQLGKSRKLVQRT